MIKPVARRTGDRIDGRLINNLTTTDKYTPYFNRSAAACANMYDDSVYIGETSAWLRDHAVGEFASLNLLHVVIAAYVRTVSAMSAINRLLLVSVFMPAMTSLLSSQQPARSPTAVLHDS